MDNLKNEKKKKYLFIIFLLIGILFFIILSNIVIPNFLKFRNLDSKTLSTDIVIKSHNSNTTILYSPRYYYEVNEISYVCASNSFIIKPSYKNKLVYYDSKNPTYCMTEYSKSSNLILSIFLIISIIIIIISSINIKNIKN